MAREQCTPLTWPLADFLQIWEAVEDAVGRQRLHLIRFVSIVVCLMHWSACLFYLTASLSSKSRLQWLMSTVWHAGCAGGLCTWPVLTTVTTYCRRLP